MADTGDRTIRDLRAAADLIRAGGWCQGTMSEGTAHCLVGALLDVTGNTFNARWEAARAALYRHIGKTRSLPRWNDAPGRTAEEVIAALEGAAASLPTVGLRIGEAG